MPNCYGRHATAEGRLNAHELEERLQALFAARTYGELNTLLADVPTGRSLSRQRVRVPRWVAAIGAVTLILGALGALTIARLHSAAEVAVPGPGGGRQFRFPGPPLADPNHRLIVAASMAAAFAVLLVCGVVLWPLKHYRAASDA